MKAKDADQKGLTRIRHEEASRGYCYIATSALAKLKPDIELTPMSECDYIADVSLADLGEKNITPLVFF